MSLRVEHVSGGYGGGHRAVEDVSFAVEAGALVAVLGPNGGGKTTLFRALLDDLPHVEGGHDAPAVAYVPQNDRTRPDFPVSAHDVVLMGAYERTPWFKRIGRADREAASAALERVGLADVARQPFGSLSGGQRQAVLIARALMQDAPVMALDEPFSALDAPTAARMEDLFRALAAEGRVLLVATHDVEQARSYDLVLCLHRRQIAFGAPAEVLTPDVLQATYGAELVLLGDGTAIRLGHHHH
jgi:ABC-type Mn2+/Zn2+ transport system ATPase subunit